MDTRSALAFLLSNSEDEDGLREERMFTMRAVGRLGNDLCFQKMKNKGDCVWAISELNVCIATKTTKKNTR